MLIVDKGFDNNIIGEHDKKVKSAIQKNLTSDCIFINTTWLEIDNEIKSLPKSKTAILYSGPDWENTVCRADQNNYIDKKFKSVVRIGNTYGDNYFSFWLDFVLEHLDSYTNFDPYNFEIEKTFMCLNRKPHSHRVELIDKIERFISDGHVSLGIDPPIQLDKDVVNKTGDNAVVGELGITNDITSLGHEDNWNSHFLNIVSETTIHTNVFLSEKVFKPIIGRRPFMILGDNRIYDVLHSWGIDTFDDILGTGYNGLYHTDRIHWIADTIKRFRRMEDLNTLLNTLQPRLESNFLNLIKAAKGNRQKYEHLSF